MDRIDPRADAPLMKTYSISHSMPPPQSVVVAPAIRIPVPAIGIPVAVSIIVPLRVMIAGLDNARFQHGECCQSKAKDDLEC
jgi:hypothetical protein